MVITSKKCENIYTLTILHSLHYAPHITAMKEKFTYLMQPVINYHCHIIISFKLVSHWRIC